MIVNASSEGSLWQRLKLVAPGGYDKDYVTLEWLADPTFPDRKLAIRVSVDPERPSYIILLTDEEVDELIMALTLALSRKKIKGENK